MHQHAMYAEHDIVLQWIVKSVAFDARSNNAPLYLSCLLHNYIPGRSLRTSQSNLLCVPSHELNFGICSFCVATPTIWNSLPADIRACTFYGSFIPQLKTFYFNNAF